MKKYRIVKPFRFACACVVALALFVGFCVLVVSVSLAHDNALLQSVYGYIPQ